MKIHTKEIPKIDYYTKISYLFKFFSRIFFFIKDYSENLNLLLRSLSNELNLGFYACGINTIINIFFGLLNLKINI